MFLNCTSPDEPYSDAHNKSYEYASGDYLVRIDNDDLYDPDYLECIVRHIEEEPDLDAFCLGQNLYDYNYETHELIKNENISHDQWYTDVSDFNDDPAFYYYCVVSNVIDINIGIIIHHA